MIDNNNEIRNLSRDLINSVRKVMEAKAGTHPKNEKEKDLASKAPPHDKITHADVLVGRGVLKKHPKTGKLVTKEEVETIDEAMSAADRFHQHHQTAKDLLKSISQHLSAHADAAKNAKDYKGKKGPNWGHAGTMEHVAQQLGGIHDMLARQGEYAMNESVELDEAPVDGVAAGSMNNNGHLCATKVFHKEWAEGTPIFSQHAEPDADGNIAWYDVMFDHGIERVMTEDVDVLMSETHERHGKRKMKEEVEKIDELTKNAMLKYLSANKKDSAKAQEAGDYDKMTKRMRGTDMAVRKYTAKQGSKYVKVPATEETKLDEARGRPRKNPLPAGQSDEPEPRQHIIQQLQRAKLSMRGGEHVTFKDGTKHHVSGDHAAKILAKYSGMRPAQKEDFQKKIGSSHAAFKEEL